MITKPRFALVGALSLAIGVYATVALASHSWGPYHWGRTANPFNLKLGDNVSSAWDAYLATASADWSLSSVLDTTVVAGSTSSRNCRPKSGRVEVCNRSYGSTGWLGVASIWVSGTHIAQGTVKLNDTYFNTSTYNKPAWRNHVMCQEVGHTLGLDHQDENFGNPPLGSCMDYSSDPTLNQHPNAHDYEQLEAIYAHLDPITTVAKSAGVSAAVRRSGDDEEEGPAKWGQEVRKGRDGRPSLYVSDHGRGQKVFTFVYWAE